MVNHAGGISVIAFVVAVAISMGYYQFVYIPEANAKPTLPEAVLNPAEELKVNIAEGASLPTNGQFFVPKETRGTIGVSNKVVWTNTDVTGHTVTTDNGYVDKINSLCYCIIDTRNLTLVYSPSAGMWLVVAVKLMVFVPASSDLKIDSRA